MSAPSSESPLSARVRRALDDRLYQRRITKREASQRIIRATGDRRWAEWKIGRILNGSYELTLDDAAVLADVAGLTLVELVREPGRELVGDLTATELRILTAIREVPSLGKLVDELVRTFRDVKTASTDRPREKKSLRSR